MGLLVCRSIRDVVCSNSKAGHKNLQQRNILHRYISIGNIFIAEDESNGFLIDLDHAIRVDREGTSGAKARTGTKVLISIGSFLRGGARGDGPTVSLLPLNRCSGPPCRYEFTIPIPTVHWKRSTEYEDCNFLSPGILADAKAGLFSNEQDFLGRIKPNFTDYYAHLVPWINALRRVVFPDRNRWAEPDLFMYSRLKAVLERAMLGSFVKADRLGEAGVVDHQTVGHKYSTRPIEGTCDPALEGH
jgi:hypothetical protein